MSRLRPIPVAACMIPCYHSDQGKRVDRIPLDDVPRYPLFHLDYQPGPAEQIGEFRAPALSLHPEFKGRGILENGGLDRQRRSWRF
jgi:hypothetical protein